MSGRDSQTLIHFYKNLGGVGGIPVSLLPRNPFTVANDCCCKENTQVERLSGRIYGFIRMTPFLYWTGAQAIAWELQTHVQTLADWRH